MRVLTGCLIQESNTFSPVTSERSLFGAGCLEFGAASLAAMAGTGTELGGFIHAARTLDLELVPTLAAWAPSGGPLATSDFDWLAGQILERAASAGPLDGVLLALHGALVTCDQPDADGWLLRRLRQVVGPDTPIVATLDLHANITRTMIDAADALVGFRTYPHLDMFETGLRAANLLVHLRRTGRRPIMTICKAPLLLPPENAQTADGPLAVIIEELRQLETRPEILSASLFPVQPWLDVPELGSTVLVVGTGDSAPARQAAEGVIAHLWARRHAFQAPLLAPAEAVRQALAAPQGPVLLVDSADGVSSGAPGDSTAILHELLTAASDRPALVTVVDPAAAAVAAAADGQTVMLTLGGRLDPARHRPVTVRGHCRRVAQTLVTFKGGIGDGLTADMGTAAVVQVHGLQILLMEKPVPCYDPALYRTAGLDPARAQAVVVKSPNNFRWAFRDVARAWLYVDAPGASTPRLASLPFQRAPRPLFPLDDWAWQPASGTYMKGEARVVD